MFGNLGQAKKYLGQAAKMLIGIPDYDNYVTHMQTNHPDQPYMTYEEFFRERQQARYGGDGKGGVWWLAVDGTPRASIKPQTTWADVAKVKK